MSTEAIIDKFTLHRFWTVFLVFGVFMVLDFVWYGLLKPVNPYTQDLVGKFIWTAILAFSYTAVYNHASTWRPEKYPTKESRPKFPTLRRIGNSLLFSLVVYALILAAIALSGYLVSVLFIYVFDAFRGTIPESVPDDAVLAAKVVAGGLVLELCGKDETEVRRDG